MVTDYLLQVNLRSIQDFHPYNREVCFK